MPGQIFQPVENSPVQRELAFIYRPYTITFHTTMVIQAHKPTSGNWDYSFIAEFRFWHVYWNKRTTNNISDLRFGKYPSYAEIHPLLAKKESDKHCTSAF